MATLSVAASFVLLPDLGWRAAFIIPAILPFSALIVFKAASKPSPASIGLPDYQENDSEKAVIEYELAEELERHGKLYPYKRLLSDRIFLLWMLIMFIQGLVCYGLVTWIPVFYAQSSQGTTTASLLQYLLFPFGMGIGTLIVPWMSDFFCPVNRAPAIVVSSIGAAVSICLFALLGSSGSNLLLHALLFLAGFFIYAINGTVWPYATDVGGRVFSGTASGVLNFASYMGAALQSFIYGALLSHGSWNALFTSMAIMCVLIALVGFLACKQRR